jgi:hypothetical protein
MAYKPKSKHTRRTPAGAKPIPPPGRAFLPDDEMQVRLIASKGATDGEIEQMFLLAPGTIAAWRERYPSFDKALLEGRAKPDADVLFALYKNACGYEFTEEAAVGGRSPCVLPVKRHARGSFDAQRYWLRMRRPEEYNIPDSHQHSGPGGGPIGIKAETRDELIASILGMIQPTPDPVPPKPKGDKRRG